MPRPAHGPSFPVSVVVHFLTSFSTHMCFFLLPLLLWIVQIWFAESQLTWGLLVYSFYVILQGRFQPKGWWHCQFTLREVRMCLLTFCFRFCYLPPVSCLFYSKVGKNMWSSNASSDCWPDSFTWLLCRHFQTISTVIKTMELEANLLCSLEWGLRS